jgi:hypothetical protein
MNHLEFYAVSSLDCLKYRVIGYTSDEFEEIPKKMVKWYGFESVKTISQIAKSIASYIYYDDPCDLDDFSCEIEFLYKETIAKFVVSGEEDISWFAECVGEKNEGEK